jgi:hypothetical protein
LSGKFSDGRKLEGKAVNAPTTESHRAIEEAQLIPLTIDDQGRFVDLLLTPPPLSPAM